MSMQIIDEAAKVFATPTAYTDETKLHAAPSHLRAHAPVSWVDVPPYRPFWAITKHADIMDIERANELFTNWPRPVLVTAENDERQAATGVRTLIHMDDPQHRVARAIGADWFRPKAMRALKARVDELAKIYVDKMMDRGPECDFMQEVAVNYPLYVILSLLGLPESDFPHPDQRDRLRDNLELMPLAVEEMIRWVTPVKGFMRTAAADTSIRGVPIAAGESVLLSYLSANRDEEAFDDPFRFDIARDPNKHVAFGYGVHFCLGAALARMELNSFFTALLPRLDAVELAGAPQHIATTFVGGLKHLPIRYSVKEGTR